VIVAWPFRPHSERPLKLSATATETNQNQNTTIKQRGGDKEKVSSSLLLFIQHLSLLILVVLLSSVAATGGFDDDEVLEKRVCISLLLPFSLYLPLLILMTLLLLDRHAGEGLAVDDCGDSDGRLRQQRRTAPKTTMEWEKKRYIVFSSFLQHLLHLLILLLLLDRHAGEGLTDTDDGGDSDGRLRQRRWNGTKKSTFFFLFYFLHHLPLLTLVLLLFDRSGRNIQRR
jgi:preprotein translocase subunit SecG